MIPGHTCEILIEPRKEEGLAFLTLVLFQARWEDYGFLSHRIRDSLIQQPLLLDTLVENNLLKLTIPYSEQETALTILSSLLNQAGITIGEKKIHIPKLGGWFDL